MFHDYHGENASSTPPAGSTPRPSATPMMTPTPTPETTPSRSQLGAPPPSRQSSLSSQASSQDENQLTESRLKEHGGLNVGHVSKFAYVGPLTKKEDKKLHRKLEDGEGGGAEGASSVPLLSCLDQHLSPRCCRRVAFVLSAALALVHLSCLAAELRATSDYHRFRDQAPELSGDAALEVVGAAAAVAVCVLLAMRRKWSFLAGAFLYLAVLAPLLAVHVVLLVRAVQARFYPTMFLLNVSGDRLRDVALAMLVVQPLLGLALLVTCCLYLRTVWPW